MDVSMVIDVQLTCMIQCGLIRKVKMKFYLIFQFLILGTRLSISWIMLNARLMKEQEGSSKPEENADTIMNAYQGNV